MVNNINIKNKKASFEYQLINTYTAGVMLLGSEIKSIRNNSVNISSAFCIFIENELFVRNLHIAEYSTQENRELSTTRDGKLLLNRQELNKIQANVKEKSMTIIPLRLFPESVREIIYFTPLQFLVDFPVSIATGNLPMHLWIPKIGLAIFWCIVVSVMGRIIYRSGIRVYGGFGA